MRKQSELALQEREEQLRAILDTDDGAAFQTGEENEGMGLKIMLYRASLIEASVTVNPVETGGKPVTCQVSGA